MREFRYIKEDEELLSIIPAFEDKGRIGVDFEGEFNLHIYGEHLCLIQVYDGSAYFIIDPRSSGITEKGLGAFFLSSAQKIFFDAQSDASLVHKQYGIVISNIYDIRIPAQVLGYEGNLRGLEAMYLGIEPLSGKKSKQRSNWLTRPISPEQIEYALSDVEHLIELKDILFHEVWEKGLEKECDARMKRALAVKTPSLPWKKIGQWQRMSRSEKCYVKNIFQTRDAIAKRFNVPAVRVMEKHMILTLSSNPPESLEETERLLKDAPPRFRKLLAPAVWRAVEKSREELKQGG